MLDRHWPAEHRTRWSLPRSVRDWIGRVLETADQVGSLASPSSRRVVGARAHSGGVTLRLIADPERSGWLLLIEEPSAQDILDVAGVRLPPRLLRVLDRLLEGDSEKEIAVRLQLSPHTIHEYAKQLYRRLEVRIRAELMARFVARVR